MESLNSVCKHPAPASLEEKPRILVVDDERFMRCTMREALEEDGFAVLESEDGKGALEQVRSDCPDIILLDVVMPEMDGFATCAALRRLPEGDHLPIVMVTGLEDTPSIARAYEAGATDFITKPLNYLLLGHRLRYILRSSRTAAALRRSQTRLAEAQRIARIGNWEWRIGANDLQLSEELCRMLGLEQEEIASFDTFLGRVHPEDRSLVEEAVAEARRRGKPLSVDHRVLLDDGSERFLHGQAEVTVDPSGEAVRMFGTFQDISERKRAEAQIRFLAHYDPLTGLPNRLHFNERLNYILAHAKRYDRRVALLFLDLDRFKVINDSLGHSMGDLLLQAVAKRLSKIVRHTDFIGRQEERELQSLARLGGDEFTTWATDIGHIQDAALIAKRILAAFTRPFDLAGHEVFITPSIGIAVYPDDGEDVEVLLKHADAAMYHAKSQGRNNYQFYSESMNIAALKWLGMENRLHRALQRGELLLHYQPLLDLRSGTVIGAEALLRWNQEGQVVSPAEFIPLAEETGLIVPIGAWVLKNACAQAKAWHDSGRGPLSVSVNLSGRQFWQQDLLQTVAAALEESGLPPAALHLEITENILMQDGESTLETLHALKSMGLRLSVDDFGTGYSSLSYLTRFPIDYLKIDRSFVADADTCPEKAAIVSAIIAMARSLKLRVIAEGVETEGQLDLLKREGCDEIQGYLIGRPLTAEDFARRLAWEA